MKLLITGACVLLTACAASRTTIQSQWADDAYSGPPLDRLAVVALFDTRAESLSFEQSAADYLAAQGIETVPGHALLSPEDGRTLDEAEVRDRVAATDVDGLLIFRLVAVDERREYQPATPYLNVPPDVATGDLSSWYYTPSPTSSFYWYWRSSADVTAAPGYWIEQTFLVAETALFDNRNDRLLWTAKSATMDDARFQRTSESIVRAVARELFDADLIAPMAAAAARGAERQPPELTREGRT
ncbi:MAG TPA: hypothetical protein VM692_15610 [Gammaproteobacteria bacterium]|nr:hypothetical protein [Gammaproteobacteria bacterium]